MKLHYVQTMFCFAKIAGGTPAPSSKQTTQQKEFASKSYGFKGLKIIVSRIFFSVTLFVFSLLGESQAASKPNKLTRNQ